MGFLLGGPYFHLKGRTGNNVGRVVKGRNVFAMRPTPSEKPPTALQLNQRQRFGLVTSWLSWITPVLDIGFEAFAGEGSPYSAAVGYNILHAVTGVSPNFTINYPQVMLSRGHRAPLDNAQAAATAGAVLDFTWDNVAQPGYAEGTDQVSIVVYNVAKQRFAVQLNAALRSAEAYELQLPLVWESDVVHLWVMVTGEGEVSNTEYLGQLTVTG